MTKLQKQAQARMNFLDSLKAYFPNIKVSKCGYYAMVTLPTGECVGLKIAGYPSPEECVVYWSGYYAIENEGEKNADN